MGIEALLGHDLIHNDKKEVKTTTLQKKFYLIYFSASWCGPCRMFMPSLIKFYNDLKKKRDDFELIFISSDRDEKSFDAYFAEMPWLAVPFQDRDTKSKLSGKFKVRGIPTLVVTDAEGNLITANGRAEVMQDPAGESFPWLPPTLAELLGTSFLAPGKEKVERNLAGKVIGLYFSAHWCPPCKRFTPILIEKYKELKAQGKDLEVVFVSSDHDFGAFYEYFAEMPWLAIPFEDDQRRSKLSDLFEVEGIPTLVFLDTDFSTITKNGVAAIYQGREFPFSPEPLMALSGSTAGDINESPALVLFADPKDEEHMKKELEPIAKETVAAKKGMIFFLGTDDPVVPAIKSFAGVGEHNPALIILDIPSQKKFVHSGEVNHTTIKQFVADYFAGTLKGHGLKE